MLDTVGEQDHWYREPSFAHNRDRVRVWKALAKRLGGIFRTRSRNEWLSLLTEASIPAGSVDSVAETFENPHSEVRGLLQEVEHPTIGRISMVKTPITFTHAKTAPATPPAAGCRYPFHPPGTWLKDLQVRAAGVLAHEKTVYSALHHCLVVVNQRVKRSKRDGLENGAPGRTRTRNPLIRSQVLYPIELRVQ